MQFRGSASDIRFKKIFTLSQRRQTSLRLPYFCDFCFIGTWLICIRQPQIHAEARRKLDNRWQFGFKAVDCKFFSDFGCYLVTGHLPQPGQPVANRTQLTAPQFLIARDPETPVSLWSSAVIQKTHPRPSDLAPSRQLNQTCPAE